MHSVKFCKIGELNMAMEFVYIPINTMQETDEVVPSPARSWPELNERALGTWEWDCTHSRMHADATESSPSARSGHVAITCADSMPRLAAFSGYGKATRYYCSKQGKRIIAVSFAGRRTAIFENRR